MPMIDEFTDKDGELYIHINVHDQLQSIPAQIWKDYHELTELTVKQAKELHRLRRLLARADSRNWSFGNDVY
ncbi:hypothetical protein [Paenibacillus sp. L3-i20]|uniref:hypothetical protein n=1 Tax=Paenibacillus sp. L3-i20 TaxID=2905833 RepID=UPI001EDE5927|nr:hypothetical protein [Paenibacillus sp. L3-i20]GKU79325.1 hypothetical protein L3i20_v237220 [Paenibacillus sp. L3-i20]